MKTQVDVMTLQQIRRVGLDALFRELGPVGMTRFLQQFEAGRGDYTQDRHTWLDQSSLPGVMSEIERWRHGEEQGEP